VNLLADESVDGVVVDRLRAGGHAVLYVAEMDPGIDDDTVLQRAARNGALLLTGVGISASSSSVCSGCTQVSCSSGWPVCPPRQRATPCRACLLTAVTKCVPRSASSRLGEYVFVDP